MQITKLQGGIGTFIQAKELYQDLLTLLMSRLSGKICLNDEILWCLHVALDTSTPDKKFLVPNPQV